jgi:hypothetical protein
LNSLNKIFVAFVASRLREARSAAVGACSVSVNEGRPSS